MGGICKDYPMWNILKENPINLKVLPISNNVYTRQRKINSDMDS